MSTGTIIVISASVVVVGFIMTGLGFYLATRLKIFLVMPFVLVMVGTLALVSGAHVAATATDRGGKTGVHTGHIEQISLSTEKSTMMVHDFDWPVPCPGSCKGFTLGQTVIIDYSYNEFGTNLDFIKVSPAH